MYLFLGKSGVQVDIAGSTEPTMTSFGELYANFLYHGTTGTMEVKRFMLFNYYEKSRDEANKCPPKNTRIIH